MKLEDAVKKVLAYNEDECPVVGYDVGDSFVFVTKPYEYIDDKKYITGPFMIAVNKFSGQISNYSIIDNAGKLAKAEKFDLLKKVGE